MLRINLLPPYIYDKKKKVQVAALWAGIVAAVAASMIFLWVARSSELAAAKAELEEATTQQTAYNKLDGDIKTVKGEIKTTQDKQEFVANAQTWNSAWPSAFEMIRDVRVEDILYKSINFDNAERKTCTIAGFAQDEVRIARWWMLLRNDRDKFDSVFMTIPTKGYDPGANSTAGAMPGGMGGMGGGPVGFPGYGGGGRPGGGMSGGGMKPMGASPMGGMGGGGRPGGMSGMSPMGMGGAAGMSRGGFGGGMGGGMGGAASGNSGPGEVEGRKGLNFTATAVLKRPIAGDLTVPVWPLGGGTGTAAGGAMGGMGGYGGMAGGRGGRGPAGVAGAMPSAATPPAAAPPADSTPSGGRRGKKDTGDE